MPIDIIGSRNANALMKSTLLANNHFSSKYLAKAECKSRQNLYYSTVLKLSDVSIEMSKRLFHQVGESKTDGVVVEIKQAAFVNTV